MRILTLICSLLFFIFSTTVIAQQKKAATSVKQETGDSFPSALLSGLKFRSIGPAITSGRIADIAVNPSNNYEYYVALSSSIMVNFPSQIIMSQIGLWYLNDYGK